jgi:uncharacterized protein (DUF1810 family)
MFEHFREAQQPVYPTVLAELRDGAKRSHWMWFIFPQLRALGRSPTARHFGLENLDDACAYLADPLLGARLRECVGLALTHPQRSAHQIFGSPDDLKFRSCLTLFAAAAPADPLFPRALATFYAGVPDPLTLDLLA